MLSVAALLLGCTINFVGKNKMKSPQKNLNKKNLFECPECHLFYKEKKWADKCEKWCKKHKSCNLKIATHAIKKGGEEI